MKRDIETLELEKMEEVNADMGGEWSILVLRVDMEAEKTLYSPEEKNYRSLISRKQDCNKSLKQRVLTDIDKTPPEPSFLQVELSDLSESLVDGPGCYGKDFDKNRESLVKICNCANYIKDQMSRLSLKRILEYTTGVPSLSVEELGLVNPPLFGMHLQ
ncbi:hypothetical protein HGM15179_004639 [Zosterops borbonicus]|uniref:Uncharacterized protein n=1 Tax=Zosterops borbonicus TaxID=364589 RepID=A0A8K1GQY8_9PASS|nr:hypothetical protein HGM15179_004639 [Zosterops borbonicus]